LSNHRDKELNNSDFFCAIVQAGSIYSLAYCRSLTLRHVLEIAGYPHSLLRKFERHRANQAGYKSGIMAQHAGHGFHCMVIRDIIE